MEIQAGEEIQLRCESQGGNPAPIIKWFIDNQELDGSLQKNETSIGNERTWNAISIIRIIFQKVRLNDLRNMFDVQIAESRL